MQANASAPEKSFLRMTELSFLLPGRQAIALERMAQREGLTVGQVIRHLIRDYIAEQPAVGSDLATRSRQGLA
jgi:hypothetical protein